MSEIVPQKRCSKCDEIKDVDQFYIKNTRNDGKNHYNSWCKKCTVTDSVERRRLARNAALSVNPQPQIIEQLCLRCEQIKPIQQFWIER
jgi:hypothetical protein